MLLLIWIKVSQGRKSITSLICQTQKIVMVKLENNHAHKPLTWILCIKSVGYLTNTADYYQAETNQTMQVQEQTQWAEFSCGKALAFAVRMLRNQAGLAVTISITHTPHLSLPLYRLHLLMIVCLSRDTFQSFADKLTLITSLPLTQIAQISSAQR